MMAYSILDVVSADAAAFTKAFQRLVQALKCLVRVAIVLLPA